jgi:hypothetical protein
LSRRSSRRRMIPALTELISKSTLSGITPTCRVTAPQRCSHAPVGRRG